MNPSPLAKHIDGDPSSMLIGRRQDDQVDGGEKCRYSSRVASEVMVNLADTPLVAD